MRKILLGCKWCFSYVHFANSWWWEIQKLKIDDKERENKKKKIWQLWGEPNFFFAVIAFLSSKPKKQNDRQN